MVAELCYEEVEEEEETVVPFEANIDLTNLTINEAVAACRGSAATPLLLLAYYLPTDYKLLLEEGGILKVAIIQCYVLERQIG